MSLRNDPMSMFNFSQEFLARRPLAYREIINEFFSALEEDDEKELEELTEDDFLYESWPIRLSRNDFISHHKSLRTAFPDWRHNASEEETIRVPGSIRITATHTGDWNVPGSSPQVIKSTQRKINLPVEYVRFDVTRRGTIKKYEVVGKSSSISTIITQLTSNDE